LPATLQDLFQQVRKTADPAAGLANEFLAQLVKRGERGFRFRSLEEARCHKDVALLLDLGIATGEEVQAPGQKAIVVRLSASARRTLES